MNEPLTIGEEKTAEVVNAGGDFAALVSISHHDSLGAHLHQMAGGTDVGPFTNGILGAGEGLVLNQLHSP